MLPRGSAGMRLLHSLRLVATAAAAPESPASRDSRRDFSRTAARDVNFRGLKNKAVRVVQEHLNEFDSYRNLVAALKNPGDVVRRNAKGIAEQCRLAKGEFKENFNWDFLVPKDPGRIDMLCTFDNDDDDDSIGKFVVTTDRTNNAGYSFASLTRTQNGTALFSGYLDTRPPKDGVTEYSGYATMLRKPRIKSLNRVARYNWGDYTHLVLKVRGDGRSYMIILTTPGAFTELAYDQYQMPLYTRGGPYWQLSKIPLSDFVFSAYGRVQSNQGLMLAKHCTRYGITLADNKTGPFKLEIDYIGLEKQASHVPVCPYESYYVPSHPQA